MRQAFSILEFDPTERAVIEPGDHIKPEDMAPNCVACFFQEVISQLLADGRLRKVASSKSEIGEHPFYDMEIDGRRLTVFHPGVGAPLAVGLLEEAIAKGGRTFIACGSSGVLDREMAVGHVVVPTSAVRDEGTSYHYASPAREATPSQEAVQAIERVLHRHNIPYVLGKCWTTDAFYRETPAKVALRKEEGCLAVEMEAAAFFTVARFRGVRFGQLLYGGDDVSGETWDARNWNQRALCAKSSSG
jgi:uridine phosphorylase